MYADNKSRRPNDVGFVPHSKEESDFQQKIQNNILNLQKRLYQQIGPINDNCDVESTGYRMMMSYLLRWHSSIYRLIWFDILIWIIIYYTISLVYRLALSDSQMNEFEDIVRTMTNWSGHMPTTFLLGFFVSNVVSRWWNIYTNIPKMGSMATAIRCCIGNGNDPEKAAKFRVNIARYLNLAWVLCLWQFCGTLKQRFKILRDIIGNLNQVTDHNAIPREISTLFNFRSTRSAQVYPVLEKINKGDELTEHDQEAITQCLLQDLVLLNQDPVVKQYFGEIITPSEIAVFEQQCRDCGSNAYNVEWWLPMHWAFGLADEAQKQGFIPDTKIGSNLGDAMSAWAGKLTTLGNYAMRNLPLVYTQVVIIAVYSFYLISIITMQFIIPSRAASRSISNYWSDYYIPIFGLLQVIFMIGWFKVAMVLLDPFGNDDEDFPFSAIFNGNLKNGFKMAGNKDCLYPKKMRAMLKTGSAPSGNVFDSDVEDSSEPVFVSTDASHNTYYDSERQAKKKRHRKHREAWSPTQVEPESEHQNPTYVNEI